ncbi:hypothetical protein UFOVP380_30 [uncultured Caudovirales phage]|uniref:Uncharacterized protein n=1 Tax=uncultured Caudovirales phage TaxID=2100421 RepID=A0A6J7WZX7_9CAUD|nr:hypothetical protein UFOVP380_30 [uncultured Caudovirales phage]
MPKAKNNQETIFQYDGVLLLPGENTVTEEEFKRLKTAKLSIEHGILELEADKKAKGEGKEEAAPEPVEEPKK